jgi:hypothetical protein
MGDSNHEGEFPWFVLERRFLLSMKKLGIAVMLTLSMCLLAGCSEGGKRQNMPEGIQSESAVQNVPDQTKDVTPENFADQVRVENISPYEGIFLEEEEKDRVENVYALKVTNISEKTILHATLNYRAGNKDLTFYLEMLPKGKSVIVAEKNRQSVKNENLKYTEGEIKYIKEGLENMESVKITPTNQSTLNVKNMTKEAMPVVWIFYRKAQEDGTLLGGRCYETGIVDLGARETYEAEAEYWMDDCEIVNVLLLDSLDAEGDAKQKLEEETTANP